MAEGEERGDVGRQGFGMLSLQAAFMRELDRLEGCESPEEIEREISRAQAIVSVGGVAIENANTILRAAKVKDEFANRASTLPKALMS